MRPLCRCLCRRALVCRGEQNYSGLHHIPDDWEEYIHGSRRYCFFWSTFEIAKRVHFRVTYLFFQIVTMPLRRRFQPERVPYKCHNCGIACGQAPYEYDGKQVPSYCTDLKCIEATFPCPD